MAVFGESMFPYGGLMEYDGLVDEDLYVKFRFEMLEAIAVELHIHLRETREAWLLEEFLQN